ncbi:MAG: NYN domain-containing protein [Enterococcus sp.]|nr:NYN domain-containing protein [Enterococcus sp.]
MKKNKAVVLVDYENIAIPLDKQHKQLDIKRDFLGSIGRAHGEDAEVYVVYTFEKFISHSSIFTSYHYRILNASSARKNSADITLAVEAIDLAHKNLQNDVQFVFICGDADYLPVFRKFESLKLNFTVYALKETVGKAFREYFEEESQFGELLYLDDAYPTNIVPSVTMDPEHVIVLKQLGIAKSRSNGKPITFKVFRTYLTNAVNEFGRRLTEEEATQLINAVIERGYVLRTQEPSLNGNPMSVFNVNELNVQVVTATL